MTNNIHYHNNKIIAIVGPTATGKSGLAIALAKKINGEIISADSRQIYRGLTIGTGKVPGKWMSRHQGNSTRRVFIYQGIRHHMVDLLPPNKNFSASQYEHLARKAIRDILARKKHPIICGGTGFWIDALARPETLAPVPPNPALRAELQNQTTLQIYEKLRKLNPRRALTIDKRNRRRLLRAVEVALVQHAMLDQESIVHGQAINEQLQILYIGVTRPNSTLKRAIRRRFFDWLEHGLLEETLNLLRRVGSERLREIGMEYPIVAEYLAGKIERKEMIEKSVNSIYRYAKRQKTWFKRNKQIHWIKNSRQAEKLTDDFMRENR